MQIGDLFERSVTRAIPPVVYFHEQGSAELQREVEEYIITGGYEARDPRASSEGIHEQFVRLLTNMRVELHKPGGPELPACWISGFYGSGKSSFAKLLGLALDGRVLPNQQTLARALLAQDRSPAAGLFRAAWEDLVDGIKPMSVVFDVGSKARDTEPVHAVAVRQVQERLGYSRISNLVAEYELKLELEKLYPAFLDKVLAVHKKPWGQLKDSQLAEDYFSAAIHALRPDLYPDPTAWVNSRAGSGFDGKRAADEAVQAIANMMAEREPGRTLFLVVDEVSQYVHEDEDRMLALQSFVAALGQRMRGRAWLLATGQQKLEEGTGTGAPIAKLKGRFPPSLRVHLGGSNIREVVHRRLLRKKKTLESDLLALFHQHRPDIALYAYRGDEISETDFVEVYPLLPGHIDLLLRITSGLRSRSGRVQGDAHEIRGLLQLLGDMFREQDLVRREPGWLITLDRVYDVLHTALDTDLHMTLNRAMEFCQREGSDTMRAVVKAVAMLELVQDDKHPTTAELVARCLYARLGDGNPLPAVQKALDALVGESLLGHSEKTGYKIESSAGQEWQRERDLYAPGGEPISEKVQQTLAHLLGDVDRISVQGLPLAWLAFFSDTLGAKDVRLHDDRKPTALTIDFQLTKSDGLDEWVPRSTSAPYKDRIVWVVGDQDALRHVAAKLVRSNRMVERYGPRQSALAEDRRRLLIEERNREDGAQRELTEAVKAAFMAGQLYFRGRPVTPRDAGPTFLTALAAFAGRVAGDLYPHPAAYAVGEKDILYLLENAGLEAPPAVLCQEKLGILSLDAGRYEVTCSGRVPQEIFAYVKEHGGVAGATLLATFGGSPHGVPPDVARAAVVGLLRCGKIRVEIAGEGEVTSVRDKGARELVKDGGLRKAKLTVNTAEVLLPRDRNAICLLFHEQLGKDVARDNDAIADAVAERFPVVRERLTLLGEHFRQLPKDTEYPEALTRLERALETCRKDRRVEPTVTATKRALLALRDGLDLLRRMENDLTTGAVAVLVDAQKVLTYEWPGLSAVGASEAARTSAATLEAHLTAKRPWEDALQLAPLVASVRDEYRAKRRAILDRNEAAIEAALDRVKRRDAFERLDPDKRHEVVRPVREGAVANTDDKAIAPALEALDGQLAARREAAEQKALQVLDALSGVDVVDVALNLGGREIGTEAEVDRLLADLRARIVHELAAKHRVRLKSG